MGGIGSESWWRWDTRTTCEEVKQIDIRYMKKHGCSGSLSWTQNGESTGDIRYRVEKSRLF